MGIRFDYLLGARKSMTRRGVFRLLGAGTTTILSACKPLGANRYRYKMTVEVETPEGVKSGFAVRELEHSGSGGWFPFGESKGRLYVKGEAVAVDVSSGKTLFALLTGQDGDVDYAGGGVATIFRVMDRDIGPTGGPHELWPKVPTIREPITDPLPMLVTFADIDDPKSVIRVDPANLAASFGPEVRLKRITVEVTKEAVTKGIEKRLGWVGSYRGSLDYTGRMHPNEPEKDLTPSAFREEIQ